MKKNFHLKFLVSFFLSVLSFSALAGFSTFFLEPIKNKALLKSTFFQTKNAPKVLDEDLLGWKQTTLHEIGHVIVTLLYPKYFFIDKVLLCKTQKILEAKGITSELCDGNNIGLTIYEQKAGVPFPVDENDFLFKRLIRTYAGSEIVKLLFQQKFHLPSLSWVFSQDYHRAGGLVNKLPPIPASQKNQNPSKGPVGWLKKAGEEIKKIVLKPRNLKLIHLLAQALYVLEVVEKDDIKFIYRHLAFPSHIKTKMQESKTTFSDRYYKKDVLKLINNYSEENLNILFEIIRSDLIKLKKKNIDSLKINDRTYSLAYLFKNTNLSSIPINELKPQAKEELSELLLFLEKPENEKPKAPLFSKSVKETLLNQSKTSDMVIIIVLSLLSLMILFLTITFIYIKWKKQQLKSNLKTKQEKTS